MTLVQNNIIIEYIEQNIRSFHDARLLNLQRLKLANVLKRKNPYLFKAKNLITARDLIKAILDAHLSSQEETIFGNFLEGLAIYLCGQAKNGRKSTVEGIDLQFEENNKLYIITIKSGPNWGNNSQIERMKENFQKAKEIFTQNKEQIEVVAINGCCYGRQERDKENKGSYLKLCGQRFWELVSGDRDLYVNIIQPIGHRATERNEYFHTKYELVIDDFTNKFRLMFCDKEDRIDWKKLTEFTSADIFPDTPH